MSRYLVNSIFYTLQGEGYWTGRPAVFVRFSRCNLWTGREEDRYKAVCQFCDTDFLHGEKHTLDELVEKVVRAWPLGEMRRMAVLTGGEPGLQVDAELVAALHGAHFYVAIETNGTRRLPTGIDWVCVSPKAGTVVVTDSGDELKIVFPQDMDVEWWPPNTSFSHYWLSPMDGPNLAENTVKAVDYVKAHPLWRLNVQTHKRIGIP